MSERTVSTAQRGRMLASTIGKPVLFGIPACSRLFSRLSLIEPVHEDRRKIGLPGSMTEHRAFSRRPFRQAIRVRFCTPEC